MRRGAYAQQRGSCRCVCLTESTAHLTNKKDDFFLLTMANMKWIGKQRVIQHRLRSIFCTLRNCRQRALHGIFPQRRGGNDSFDVRRSSEEALLLLTLIKLSKCKTKYMLICNNSWQDLIYSMFVVMRREFEILIRVNDAFLGFKSQLQRMNVACKTG